MAAGDSLRVWIYFQVNPTNLGTRSQDVELDDGGPAPRSASGVT